jgi:hypothetical protein
MHENIPIRTIGLFFSINRINYEWFLLKKKTKNKTATIIKESKQNNEKSINKLNQELCFLIDHDSLLF